MPHAPRDFWQNDSAEDGLFRLLRKREREKEKQREREREREREAERRRS